MPVVKNKLYIWQHNKLSTGAGCLDAKIQKEISENEWSTKWSEQRERLFDCVAQNNCAKLDNKWEQKYAEFERCMEMPTENSKLYNWQHNQLNTGAGGLDAKIQREIAENEGSTMWSDRRVRLCDCIGQKKKNCAKLDNKWEQKYAMFIA